MAKEKRTVFPNIAENNWWALREKFKQTVPTTVTKSYLASSLNMTEESARSNVLGPLKRIDFIDDNGKPTDLAKDWRLDEKYPEVCEKIREKVYPQELHDTFPTADADQSQITNWFMRTTGFGEPAAKKQAAFYKLLLKADPSEAAEALREKPAKKAPVPKAKKPEAGMKKETKIDKGEGMEFKGGPPSLHLNIQIHIAPDASPDQIDKIFASMAHHLKPFLHT